MDKEIDSVLDLQIEVVQVSIYCEIIKDILLIVPYNSLF